MPQKRHKAEQIIATEASLAKGKTVPQVCKQLEIAEQTYYRWRKEYGGLKMDQAKRLRDLEKENTRLKTLE